MTRLQLVRQKKEDLETKLQPLLTNMAAAGTFCQSAELIMTTNVEISFLEQLYETSVTFIEQFDGALKMLSGDFPLITTPDIPDELQPTRISETPTTVTGEPTKKIRAPGETTKETLAADDSTMTTPTPRESTKTTLILHEST